MKEEFSEEQLLKIAEVLRRRFVLMPKITATETIDRIREIVREEFIES